MYLVTINRCLILTFNLGKYIMTTPVGSPRLSPHPVAERQQANRLTEEPPLPPPNTPTGLFGENPPAGPELPSFQLSSVYSSLGGKSFSVNYNPPKGPGAA